MKVTTNTEFAETGVTFGREENNNNMEKETVEVEMDRSKVSPPRPSSLLLLETAAAVLRESVIETNDATDTTKPERRRKKKRATDHGVKKFNDLYEPVGEKLGEGSFGSVLTYRKILTGKEYAVKNGSMSEPAPV